MVVMAVAGAGREMTEVRRGVIDRARLARTDDMVCCSMIASERRGLIDREATD